jgi:hypothetical protein
MHNKPLLFSFLFFTFLTIYSLNIPFFWDGTFVSAFACKLYDGTYTIFSLPPISDNNTIFPLFSAYLFIVWKLFTKSLLVAHLAMLPFLLGICYEFYQLSKRFLQDKFVYFALLLLILEPTFITQSILISYDIILLYLFLLLLNQLLKEQYKMYFFLISILVLYSVRGIFLTLSLAVIQFILIYPKNKYRSFLIVLKTNLLSFIFICLAVFLKFRTVDANENPHEQIVSFTMMLRQLIFIGWKIADFGRIVLWLFFIIGIYFIYKRKKEDENFKALLLIIFIPALLTAIFMIPFSNPIAHRYFMFTYLLLIIGVCYILQHINSKKIVYSLMLVFVTSSFTGNFWLYPERYGNGWDSSLKVLPYFQLKDQMDKYIQQNKIAAGEVGTQFPLIADKVFSYLSDTSYHYMNVWSGPIDIHPYFLQSNVINTDIPEQIETVKKNWSLLKEFKSGQVYLKLYENKRIILTTSP